MNGPLAREVGQSLTLLLFTASTTLLYLGLGWLAVRLLA